MCAVKATGAFVVVEGRPIDKMLCDSQWPFVAQVIWHALKQCPNLRIHANDSSFRERLLHRLRTLYVLLLSYPVGSIPLVS